MSWEENVRKVVPYTPGEQPKNRNVIKLNTNECPYPPAPGVKKALQKFDVDTLRLYPDPSATVLVDALAEYYGVKSSQVFVGVGSDDVLAMIFMTFFNSKNPIIFPDITYSFYDVWADLFRIPYQCPALDEKFHIRKEDYFGENGGVIFPNPNAPTGVELSQEDIEEIIQHNQDVIVIVDEAYVDFGAKSALPLIEKYDNLLIVQTFSKSRSMAGMRIGFACGDPALIRYLNDVKYSFNSYTMDRTTLAAGVASVRDREYLEKICHKITDT
ncbi:MAG: aminotransferase class I/II-fold pyridoxal phosphate-dependent enzyme, partial [Lachnospiraceae bacterium]|nr:aminotransferase class I/II-fold pyridoxal phosphate-dependent enzyme [Lachnospiraceae bacterium]